MDAEKTLKWVVAEVKGEWVRLADPLYTASAPRPKEGAILLQQVESKDE